MKRNRENTSAQNRMLRQLGLEEHTQVFWNLTPPELYEEAIRNDEGELTKDYALRVLTGEYTGRSPTDRFIVREPSTEGRIDWGEVNRPVSPEVFDRLHERIRNHLASRKLYVKDLYAGADPDHRLHVRIASEAAYHALFAHNMFIRPTPSERQGFEPGFTVLAAPHFRAEPDRDGTRTGTFILCSFDQRLILIGGTLYSGELKKGIFSVLNYLLPEQGIMPMHCSANRNEAGESALFFGLSGTGKTTLSSDPDRILIGDDEHGWSDHGIFNFEGGCYAKTINLSQKEEPLIYATTRMPGTILENVVLDEEREPDFNDDSLTENTRCAYPIHYIPNASETGTGDHPTHLFFLTCDAFGVLPPISRLSPEQAMYHFISGYTAKVAGTERGVTDPVATFSACFGAPFIPLHPTVYAALLADKIRLHDVNVWMVNTGWIRGPEGVGERIPLRFTRAILTSTLTGELTGETFIREEVFGLEIPVHVEGVPSDILTPRNSWKDSDAYDEKSRKLAGMFHRNMEQFRDKTGRDLLAGGPASFA